MWATFAPSVACSRLRQAHALKRADYVDNVVVAVKLKVLDDGVITESVLRDILEYAAEGGVGADRSQGGGHINSWELTV